MTSTDSTLPNNPGQDKKPIKARSYRRKKAFEYEYNQFASAAFIKASMELTNANLRQGNNVLFTSDGKIVVHERRTIIKTYDWDPIKSEMIETISHEEE